MDIYIFFISRSIFIYYDEIKTKQKILETESVLIFFSDEKHYLTRRLISKRDFVWLGQWTCRGYIHVKFNIISYSLF